MSTTRINRHIRSTRDVVYRALIDADAVAAWRVPDGMSSEVHEFDPREGGAIRVSLTYRTPDAVGKSGADTDTYHGRFVTLVPNERVVEVLEFETDDPAMQGEMRITFSLSDADGGTDLSAVHEGVPSGVSPRDNDTGWRMSLDKLAAYAEARETLARRRPAK